MLLLLYLITNACLIPYYALGYTVESLYSKVHQTTKFVYNISVFIITGLNSMYAVIMGTADSL